MVNFATRTYLGFFGFYKIAYFGIVSQFCARSQAGKGPENGVIAHYWILNNGIGFDFDAIAYGAINNLAVGANMHIWAQLNIAFEDAIDIDKVIGAYP